MFLTVTKTTKIDQFYIIETTAPVAMQYIIGGKISALVKFWLGWVTSLEMIGSGRFVSIGYSVGNFPLFRIQNVQKEKPLLPVDCTIMTTNGH